MNVPAIVNREEEQWQLAARLGIHIFGAGAFARAVAAGARHLGIVVHDFLVSSDPIELAQDGIPIRRIDAAALASCPTWIGVFNRESRSDYSALRAQIEGIFSGARLVWPQTFYGWLQQSLGWRFWLHPVHQYADFAAQIARARSLLEDQESKQTLDLLMNFRRLASTDWASPRPSADPQYMPAWLAAKISGPLRIVDAGAYRGETLRELSGLNSIESAWTFEPDPENYAMLVRNLSDWPGSLINIPAGLSNRTGTASFSSGNGEGSSFVSDGNSQLTVVALDDCLHRMPVNFLKLDVEGSELLALDGARATLQRERPMLAVAGYHRWDDLWRIPEFIAELGLNYRLRLGLHGHNSFDCVFYAY